MLISQGLIPKLPTEFCDWMNIASPLASSFLISPFSRLLLRLMEELVTRIEESNNNTIIITYSSIDGNFASGIKNNINFIERFAVTPCNDYL